MEIPGILSIAIFLPFISAVIVAVFLTGKAARGFAVIASALELVVTGYIFVAHRQNGYDFSEKITSSNCMFYVNFHVQNTKEKSCSAFLMVRREGGGP